ncbi:sensor histidine kinase [Chitinophaga sp. GbtcB8]|uniref:sensor histidine kinase n=1 Tax=Chitinophaga sp. GbtcB8 TaxID=2824753 RepID=UPI001C2FAC51|nr:sensor histidine kinase [Chitinophaga sp. GbtcB8]
MSRFLLHILFWVVYLLQDSLLQFLWVAPAIPQVPEGKAFVMAVMAGIAAGIPKMIFVYFILCFSMNRILKEGSRIWLEALYITLVFIVVLIFYRAVFSYYVYMNIYHGLLKPSPMFGGSSLMVALMDFGFVTGTAVTLHLLRKQLTSKEREKNLVKEKLETELKFLRNQTNPHFLFNTLNNIYVLARKKSDLTAEIVMKLSKLLRFMLYETSKTFIPVADEIKMLDDYLELEKIRYNDRLTITFEKEIDNGAYPLAPLLLLPFVENAFKHGVSESRFDSFIYIDIKLQEGRLTFRIENTKENGGAHPVTDNIGLGNVRRQLELMYKDYQLEVEDQHTLFKVYLTINLDSHAKI